MREEYYPKKVMESYEDYQLIAKLSNPKELTLRKRVASEIKEFFGDKKIKILEIGGGNGEATEFIFKNVKNAKITTIDSDLDMNKRMKERLSEFVKNGRLIVIQANALEHIVNISDQEFDCFTSSWTIHNFENVKKVNFLREVFRIMKEGGLFIIMDKCYTGDVKKDNKMLEDTFKSYGKMVEIGKEELFNEIVKHENDDFGEDYIMIEKELTDQLEEIEFNDIKMVKRIGREAILTAKK